MARTHTPLDGIPLDDPREQLDSLPGVMWHLSDAWARRDQPNVLLVHHDNLPDMLGLLHSPRGNS